MKKGNKRSKLYNSLCAHRPATNLIGINNEDITPQEIELDNEDTNTFYQELSHNSNIDSEAIPMTICPQSAEEAFMVDSLNDQGNIIDYEKKYQKEDDRLNSIAEESVDDSNFIDALQHAINHFEDANTNLKERNYRNKRQSPASTNITTSNSVSEEFMNENEIIKKLYNTLAVKYNEIKETNKRLMGDCAILRSQLEEEKAVSIA